MSAGNREMLDFDVSVPEGVGEGATVAVLLHGRGSHKGDLQALAPVLPSDWVTVTPQAPYPGHDWGYGSGWAWYRYIQDDIVDEDTLRHSLERVDDFLAGLPQLLPFAPGNIVLGGFSQGGTMSVAYSLSHPGAVTAAWNFSGFLAAPVIVPEGDDAARATPIFWGHGTSDPNIPLALGQKGRDRLKAAGVPLVAIDYGIGHWIVPDEIHDAVAMVERPG